MRRREIIKWTHRPPKAWEKATKKQLTVLIDLIRIMSCFVGFGLSEPNQGRTAKAMRGVGYLMGPGGNMIYCEFRGCSDYARWRKCRDWYAAAMTML